MGLKFGPGPRVPISTSRPAADFFPFPVETPGACGPGPVSHRIFLQSMEPCRTERPPFPCSINNTGAAYCPRAGRGLTQLRQIEGGGGPFTGPSRVSTPADSGQTLPLRPCTDLLCDRCVCVTSDNLRCPTGNPPHHPPSPPVRLYLS